MKYLLLFLLVSFGSNDANSSYTERSVSCPAKCHKDESPISNLECTQRNQAGVCIKSEVVCYCRKHY